MYMKHHMTLFLQQIKALLILSNKKINGIITCSFSEGFQDLRNECSVHEYGKGFLDGFRNEVTMQQLANKSM